MGMTGGGEKQSNTLYQMICYTDKADVKLCRSAHNYGVSDTCRVEQHYGTVLYVQLSQ